MISERDFLQDEEAVVSQKDAQREREREREFRHLCMVWEWGPPPPPRRFMSYRPRHTAFVRILGGFSSLLLP
jgi:hypothetical protein